MELPTQEQIAAGNKMAADLVDANIAATMGSLGGNKPAPSGDNADIISLHQSGVIDSVTAIYMAMRRVPTGRQNLYHWVGPSQLLVRAKSEDESRAILSNLLDRTSAECRMGTIDQWNCHAIVDEVEAGAGIYFNLQRIGATPGKL